MSGRRLVAAAHRGVPTALILVCAFAGVMGINPAAAAAQGPPSGIPGRGPVVFEGELEVTYEDDDENGRARLLHFVHADNRRIPLRFQNGTIPDLPTGARVRVSGDLADGAVTATEVTVMSASASRTLGPQDVLVILFNFSNNATQPWTMTTVDGVNEHVRKFYVENTYGQTELSFTVAGYYTIAAENTTCDYYGWAAQAEAAATNAGVNLSAYDRYVFAFPKTSACGWSGMGNLSGPRSWTNGSYSVRTLAHEQGHNFGDHHSKSMPCSGTSCSTVEYGDDRDVLGRSGVVGHINAFQKERLGWLNYGAAPVAQTVSASGHYWIDNYETLTGNTKALKIWNAAKNGYYYVESRAKVGFDANVSAGVTLHLGQSGISYQVDLDTATSTFDSTLDVGQVFTDSSMGLSIETISTGLDGAMVAVTMESAPCTTANPSVTLDTSGTLRYTVMVRNNNSPTCAASVFSLAAAVPSGWTASFSPSSSPSIAPGASASTTMTLTPPAETSGSYPFSVSATDSGSGNSATASGTASVSSVSNLTVTASASYSTSGKGGKTRTATIAVDVKADTQAVAGARVSIVVTNPNGGTTTLNSITDGNGNATLKMSLRQKDPTGVYQVQVSASASGSEASGQTTTSFTVP